MIRDSCFALLFFGCHGSIAVADEKPAESRAMLQWSELPALPDELGVAGPFAGVHNDALIVAGGANFPKPVWENDKVWHDAIYVLTRSGEDYVWKDGGKLPRPLAYGAAVSTADGVVCIGGNDADETFSDVFSAHGRRSHSSGHQNRLSAATEAVRVWLGSARWRRDLFGGWSERPDA